MNAALRAVSRRLGTVRSVADHGWTAAMVATLVAAMILVVTAGATVALSVGPADAAGALVGQNPPTTTVTTLPDGLDGNLGRIIPRPNSGRAPEHPGDRGGWLQLTVFVVMTAGLLLIAGLVVRESRRARADASRD